MRTLVDTGSSKLSFIIKPFASSAAGFAECSEPECDDARCGGGKTVSSSGTVQVWLRFRGTSGSARSELVTLCVLDLPVDMLLGMDLLRDLRAVVDVDKGIVEFRKLKLVCSLERYGDAGVERSAIHAAVALGQEY